MSPRRVQGLTPCCETSDWLIWGRWLCCETLNSVKAVGRALAVAPCCETSDWLKWGRG